MQLYDEQCHLYVWRETRAAVQEPASESALCLGTRADDRDGDRDLRRLPFEVQRIRLSPAETLSSSHLFVFSGIHYDFPFQRLFFSKKK